MKFNPLLKEDSKILRRISNLHYDHNVQVNNVHMQISNTNNIYGNKRIQFWLSYDEQFNTINQ